MFFPFVHLDVKKSWQYPDCAGSLVGFAVFMDAKLYRMHYPKAYIAFWVVFPPFREF